ncbi:hypothetical protein X979_5824 [Burkholderia pseudomallei MSHR7527]|nr:hypothetical protein X941_4251 [Burkholderia pseudomallei MSHR5569]KGS54668.1 hypothetical protein X949_5113 [Burkholderia pseudomallei MSHR5609]KGS71037.1 hypothetical protein X979_5824 [Burkholderia pseudomallei MSHR7527]KGS72940.1 hypothetical protein X942_5926 [Burkholderia pseudomallei MSHR5596]KGX51207.1 hypothetical protein Y025_5205 [Burkholderia pseudomallei TSV32]KGX51840.1 hypothetical protein Y027_5082 [Burkholderia pseudomallei TSV5]
MRFLNRLEYHLVTGCMTGGTQSCEEPREIGIDIDMDVVAVRHEQSNRLCRATGE